MQKYDKNTDYKHATPYKQEAFYSDSDEIFKQLKMDPFKYHRQKSEDPVKPFDLSSESESKENLDGSQLNFDGKGV